MGTTFKQAGRNRKNGGNLNTGLMFLQETEIRKPEMALVPLGSGRRALIMKAVKKTSDEILHLLLGDVGGFVSGRRDASPRDLCGGEACDVSVTGRGEDVVAHSHLHSDREMIQLLSHEFPTDTTKLFQRSQETDPQRTGICT